MHHTHLYIFSRQIEPSGEMRTRKREIDRDKLGFYSESQLILRASQRPFALGDNQGKGWYFTKLGTWWGTKSLIKIPFIHPITHGSRPPRLSLEQHIHTQGCERFKNWWWWLLYNHTTCYVMIKSFTFTQIMIRPRRYLRVWRTWSKLKNV